jgi:hypothetical protein
MKNVSCIERMRDDRTRYAAISYWLTRIERPSGVWLLRQERCALSFSAKSVFSQEKPPSASGARPK